MLIIFTVRQLFLHDAVVVSSNFYHAIVNPSCLKHALWASIDAAQPSKPLLTTHKSLISLVSGQLQQIFFPDLPIFTGATSDISYVVKGRCSWSVVDSVDVMHSQTSSRRLY